MTSLAVKVAVKVRPLNRRENAQHEKECTLIEPAPGNLKTIKLGPDGKSFTYDYVVDHTEKASEFYENSVSNLVDGLFDGYNATVLAYGQTGSGKTYSMGTSGKMSETEEENLGVVPRAARQIFQMIDALVHKYKDKQHKPVISVGTQFLELYQDKLVDLYDCKSCTPPRITQDQDKGIQVNSTAKKVKNAEEIIEVLQEGAQNRQVGGTNMNAESSRSHAVFIIDITQKELAEFEIADEENPNKKDLTAKFCLVDLAGSERLGKTGAEGGRKQEGIAINQGLLALGNVISALGNPRKKAHVNYRDTKLTLLLKDSLGGNSKTLMIACISPSAGEINETKNTLEYANRARSIKNTPKKNQDETSLHLANLKERIAELEATIQKCTCGHATVNTRFKTEPEEEQEEIVDNNPENKHVLSQQRQVSTNSLLNLNRLCSVDDEAMRFSQPISPTSLFTDEQSLVVQQKNEGLEARVKSFQIVNTRISHELAGLKTRMALLKISYKATNEKEMDAMMIQQLHDYKLKNEELEMEMSCRKKYYSLLDEYRRVREKCTQPVTNQSNERMAQDILALAEEDVIRREEFYDSLPGTILRPRKRKRRRRAKYRLLPKQLSSCLFDLADYENASEEVLNTVLKAEAIYSSYRDGDYYECREKLIYENELQIILKERENNNQKLEQLTSGFYEKSELEENIIMEQTEQMEELRKKSESNASVEQEEPSLYSAEDYANASGEVLAMMRREETAFVRENVRRKLKEQKESESNASVEQEEPSLYSAKDYANASGEVLAMMRRNETAFVRENAKRKLKEHEESRKESESNAIVEQEEPSLYSAKDYANASGEVLAMMRRNETAFVRENAKRKLKEHEESRKESASNASVEQEEPSLYSAEDYADASGEVLAMMRRNETAFVRENAKRKLKEHEESRKESASNASVEQEEPSLYSAEDYADASGEVLAMMRRNETAFVRENARRKLKEQEESRKESESNASVEQEEPSLYSAEDYADASGEVLAMMRRNETAFVRENAKRKLKEHEESRKESASNASVEQEEPSLYSAEDYADASGEVLAMMRRNETAFVRENARRKLKEQEESRKESESNASVEQEEPSLYSAEDYGDASGEVLAMMRREETAFVRENARRKLKEHEESRKESESNASVEQEEPSLYSAEDYGDASGEVLAMMRREETAFARENARRKLKEQKESRKESESNAIVEQEEPSLYSAEDYANASGEVLAMMRREETAFVRENARRKLKEQEESRKESESNASVEQEEPSLYSAEDYANAFGEVLAMMRRNETAFDRERTRRKLKEQKESRKESESNASVEQEEPSLYSAEDYANASGEVLAMMRRNETAFDRERARRKLKEQKESRKESESNASVEQEEPNLYSAEDYANASGEVLAMMRREETAFARDNARRKLKEQKESGKESEANASVEQKDKLVKNDTIFADTPDEIPRATGVPLTRSKARVSLRDIKLSCNNFDPLDSGLISESSIESHNEPDREVVPIISLPGGEQNTEVISQQDYCLPVHVDILNNTLREEPINLSERTALRINSSLFPTSEQHCNAGDLISSLPEEDQAIQVAIQMESIENVTVPSPILPIEIINSETSNPYYLKYLDFSTDTNSEIDSDGNEPLDEADEYNPNHNILNPDVRILLEDINFRKNLARQLKQEKVRHSAMSNQSRERIRELEIKINRLEDLREKLFKEVKELKNTAKVPKNPTKNSDEKKVSNLSKELTEEKKKLTSLNKELNEEKKKSKQLEKELTQAQGIENWKIAFEISEKKRKELEANIKVSKKKVDIVVKDQANKIKDFEKKAEIQMSNDKSKTKEVNKCNAENSKLNKEYSESKKKNVILGEKNSRLQSLLTKLTKTAPPTSTEKKNATKTIDNSGKFGDRKNAPSRTPSMRESKEQEAKDTAKSLELIEKLINSNLNKPGVMQHIEVLVEKRVNSQIVRNRKSVVRKIAAIEMNKKERSFDKSIQKDDKSIELRGLKFDAKKLAGDLPEDVTSFVSALNEKRCKRTLEAIFLHLLYEGVGKKVKMLEEERLNSANNEFTEKISKIENLIHFIKDELMVVDTQAKKTGNPSLNHSYSTSDLSHVKLNRLPSQSEQISIRVPSSENLRTASPNLSSTSRHNASKSNLSSRSGYHCGLSSNSNSNSTSNLRSYSPAKFISSLQNKSAAASSTGSLCPNKQAPPNKSPTKHPTLVRTKTQCPLPSPRDPVKKAVSVSTPLSPHARSFPLCQSADDTLLTPTTKPPFLAFPPRSNSNKKSSPSNSLPVCTSRRANTIIPIRHTNSPVVPHPTIKSILVVSPTPNSNPSAPLSSKLIGTQAKPKQQQTEPIQSTKHSPIKAITHTQESQNITHQKYKQPLKAARRLDILKPCITYSEENMKSILTLQLGEDALITASSNCTIRCLDLETLKEKYAQGPMHITDIVRKLEYRMCDKLLYVSSGKKIKIFDLRTQEPVFEIKGFCGDKSTISDMVTTMDPNFIYLACGPDVLVWELTSNKVYGKLIGNSSTITTMCYGVRNSKQPFLAICCKDQSVKIYDYPEAHWCKLTDSSADSASSSSLNQIPSPKPTKLSIKSFSFPENVYTPLFQGFVSKTPFVANKMAYLNNSSIVHYEDVLLLANNVDIFQYNLSEKKLQNQINTVQSAKNSSKNISDLTNMVRFPNQPLLVTTCRKGSINFWDPTTLKLFGKQNCFANTQFLYDNQHVMILSCNNRMIATTNNKKPHLVKLWSVDMDFLNSP